MRSEMSYFCTTAELRGLVEDKKVTSRMVGARPAREIPLRSVPEPCSPS
jgi:hypothetical protein